MARSDKGKTHKFGRDFYIKRYGAIADHIIKYRKTHRKGLPWSTAYHNIYGRCNIPTTNKYSFYGGRGIRCLISISELKETYIRDSAWMLKHPSVGRINHDEDYCLANIRWQEFRTNRTGRPKGS